MKTEQVEPGSGPGNSPSRSTARILVGLILLAIGVGWLLEAADLIDFPSRVVLPVALVLVGVALITQARRRHSGGLIAIGIILTAVLTFMPDTRIGFDGGVGERIETPQSINELQPEYRLGMGSFTLDLFEVRFPEGSTDIEARVGMGELRVFVPQGVDVVIEARTGAGDITVFGRQLASGLGAKVDGYRVESTGETAAGTETTDTAATDASAAETPTRELRFELRVGLGPIKVIHGSA